MKRPSLIIILMVLISPLSLFADEAAPPEKMTLDVKTAVKLAREHSYSLRGTSLDLDTKRAAAQGSFSLLYPSASVNGSLQMGASETAGVTTDTNRLSVGVSLGLSLDSTIPLRIRQLWNEYESGRATLAQAESQLAVTVKKYYYNLVLSAGQVDLLRKQTDAAAKRLETAEYRLSLGLISQVDKLTVEYAYKDKQYSLTAAENVYKTSLLQLKQVCGIDSATSVTLSDGIPEAARPAYDPALALDNPDIRISRLQKKIAETARDLSLAALLPSLNLGLDFSGAFQTDPLVNPLFDAGSWNDSASAAARISLVIPLDVYLPYSGTRQALEGREVAVKKMEYAIREQTETVRRQAETLTLSLRQLENQLETLGVNIRLAEQNMKLIEELYNAGKKSLLDVKDAENSLYSARWQLVNAKYQYIAAVLDLGYLLNIDTGL